MIVKLAQIVHQIVLQETIVQVVKLTQIVHQIVRQETIVQELHKQMKTTKKRNPILP